MINIPAEIKIVRTIKNQIGLFMHFYYNKSAPLGSGALLDLDFADLDRIESFRALRNFKRHFISFAKLFELYVLELVGVEKEFFFLVRSLDETEAFVFQFSDYAFLHVIR